MPDATPNGADQPPTANIADLRPEVNAQGMAGECLSELERSQVWAVQLSPRFAVLGIAEVIRPVRWRPTDRDPA